MTGKEVFEGNEPYPITVVFETLKSLNETDNKLTFWENVPHYYIFHGAPGSGKTHSISWLSFLLQRENIDIPIYLQKKTLDTGYVGSGENTVEKNMNDLRARALKTKNKTVIYVIDEADSVVPRRDSLISASHAPTVNAFLGYMDGFNTLQDVSILIIALTNNFESLDKAFRSRATPYEFCPSKKALAHIVAKSLGDDFLDECCTLKSAFDKKMIFKNTGDPVGIRDIDLIKKNMNQYCIVNKKNFNKENKAKLFDALYSVQNNQLVFTPRESLRFL